MTLAWIHISSFLKMNWKWVLLAVVIGGAFVWHQVHAGNARKLAYDAGYDQAISDVKARTKTAQAKLDAQAPKITEKAAHTIEAARKEASHAAVEIRVAVANGEDPVAKWNAGLDGVCEQTSVCAERAAEDRTESAADDANAGANASEPAGVEGVGSSAEIPRSSENVALEQTLIDSGSGNLMSQPAISSLPRSLVNSVRKDSLHTEIDLPCEALGSYSQSCLFLKEDYGKLASFSVEAIAALGSSEAKRIGLVELIEAANDSANDPRP